jgi:hypothetical protein
MKKVFITVGVRNAQWNAASVRLAHQIKSLDIFDEIYGHEDGRFLGDLEFWDRHQRFWSRSKKGCGYWLWKPYIIMKHLEQLEEGDILVYADAGCEVRPTSASAMRKMIDIACEHKKIVGSHTCIEREWTKMDLILALDANKPEHLDSAQWAGGTNMFIKTPAIMNLVESWYEIGCDYHMIDDSPSVAPNLPCFKRHRHDQSIFSLLVKTRNLIHPTANLRLSGAIHSKRNKNGKCRLTGKTYESVKDNYLVIKPDRTD